MARISFKQFQAIFALVVVSSFLVSCGTQATSKYYGVTKAPEGQVLRYISGSEPESLDPQVPTGQPEARVLMALYDGLVEYDPKTMDPIPAIAENWEVSKDGTEFLFRLRKNATFSNGAPITAKDVAYTFRRGLSPELAAQNAYLAYYIKYGEAYNSAKAFVKNADGSVCSGKRSGRKETCRSGQSGNRNGKIGDQSERDRRSGRRPFDDSEGSRTGNIRHGDGISPIHQ